VFFSLCSYALANPSELFGVDSDSTNEDQKDVYVVLSKSDVLLL